MADDQNNEKDTHIVSTPDSPQKPVAASSTTSGDVAPKEPVEAVSKPIAVKATASEKARQTLPTHPVEQADVQKADSKPTDDKALNAIEKASSEAKKYRIRLRDTEKKLTDLQSQYAQSKADAGKQIADAQKAVQQAQTVAATVKSQAEQEKQSLRLQLFKYVAIQVNRENIGKGTNKYGVHFPNWEVPSLEPKALDDVLAQLTYSDPSPFLKREEESRKLNKHVTRWDIEHHPISVAECYTDDGKLNKQIVDAFLSEILADHPYMKKKYEHSMYMPQIHDDRPKPEQPGILGQVTEQIRRRY